MSEKKKDKIIETLYEELKRKDELIRKLKEDNEVLIRTSIKSAERLQEMQDSFANKKI
jgi:hypothetical protein